jgi:hypothetical protein
VSYNGRCRCPGIALFHRVFLDKIAQWRRTEGVSIGALQKGREGRVALVAVRAPFCKTFASDFSYRKFYKRPLKRHLRHPASSACREARSGGRALIASRGATVNNAEAGSECARRASVSSRRIAMRTCRTAVAFFAGPRCGEELPRQTARGSAACPQRSQGLNPP